MSGPAAGVLACLAGLALMGCLPVVFFRRGRLTPGWWMTAAPFFLAAATLVAAGVGALTPGIRPGRPWDLALQGASVVLVVAAAALMGLAAGSHAAPVSLWHQDGDTPDGLTTGGAYARIRHPFYAAFLLLLLACVLAFPHGLTLATWIWAAIRLDRTAAREERRLLASAHGARYRAYMRDTGRFVPGGRRPSGPGAGGRRARAAADSAAGRPLPAGPVESARRPRL